MFCCGYYIEQAHINNKRIRIILIFHSNNYYNNKLPLSDEISILVVVLSVRSNHCKYLYRTVLYSLGWCWYQIKTNETKYILHYYVTFLTSVVFIFSFRIQITIIIVLGHQNCILAVFLDCHLNLGNTRTTMHNSSFLVTMNTGAHHKLEFALLKLR